METIFLNGMPMHLIGSLPVAGSVAENFVLVSRDLTDISLDDFKGKRIILNYYCPLNDRSVSPTS